MIDPENQDELKGEIATRIISDSYILDDLRQKIRPLLHQVRQIQQRTTTSISLVGTDGGNNKVEYDPFLVQLVRVVDSSNNQYCLEVISPSTNIKEQSMRQFNSVEGPSALGKLMSFLGARDLVDLSQMIVIDENGLAVSPSWVQVYRHLVEWAILFDVIRNKDFGTDTLIVFDGLLRSKSFRGRLFEDLIKAIWDSIQERKRKQKRNIYLVGLAKHTSVLSRYRLAMSLEGVLSTNFPSYVEIPRTIEAEVYKWDEYSRGIGDQSGEGNKFVGGKMFFAKFGGGRYDPIWPVDVLEYQLPDADKIFGYLLADAIHGFPIPFYPLCLQKAHENAALVDFDYLIMQDFIMDAIRSHLGMQGHVLDVSRIQETDVASRRYGDD